MNLRRFSPIFLIIIIVIILAYLGESYYISSKVMPIPRLPIENIPASIGLVYEDVLFLSSKDNVTLRGWYITGNSSKVVIIINGGYQNRNDISIPTLEITRDLVNAGFNVLLFDLRGRGESEGKAITLTNNDNDIQGSINYVMSIKNDNIYILGFSSGAASTILTIPNVKAIVLDNCFASVPEMLIKGMTEKGFPKMIANILSPGVFLMSNVIFGYELKNPIDIINNINCPILFIHGKEDMDVPVKDAYRLYSAASNPNKELWIAPNAKHCQSYKINPEEYMERVVSFLEEAANR